MCCDRGPPFAAASRNCAAERLVVALSFFVFFLTGQGVRGRAGGGVDCHAPGGGRGSLGERQEHGHVTPSRQPAVAMFLRCRMKTKCS